MLKVGGPRSLKTVVSNPSRNSSGKETTTVCAAGVPGGGPTREPGSVFARGTPSKKIVAAAPITRPTRRVIMYLIAVVVYVPLLRRHRRRRCSSRGRGGGRCYRRGR